MLSIKPDSLWENGYAESFNSRLRDELACSLLMAANRLGDELWAAILFYKFCLNRIRLNQTMAAF